MKEGAVLVYMIANLANRNGSAIWIDNLLKSLSRLYGVDFTIVSTYEAEAFQANDDAIRALGFDHIFLPFERMPTEPAGALLGLTRVLLDKYYFSFERKSLGQGHIDDRMVEIVRRVRPDLIIVNDIWSAMCFRSAVSLGIPSCLVTLNNEVAFHRDARLHVRSTGTSVHEAVLGWICKRWNWVANWRMERYVTRLFAKYTGIAALTIEDLPLGLPIETLRAIFPPLLEESVERWSYQCSRSLLFVGSVAHYPNRLAVEWICQKFAPELLRADEEVRIVIIGVSEDHVPAASKQRNVTFLGLASRADVIRHMTSDDVFIAPIDNPFGAKLKLAECASYGMPFLATEAAMSGLQFLTCIPLFDLNKPADAVRLLLKYINAPGELSDLSDSITERMRQARKEQSMMWAEFIQHLMSRQCE